ncbi:succinate dehydrogenase cytochrome b subunit [Halobacteriovorax sp. GB3]|uniref:succinate dehydrogenase cytochrome b subunit n=1 Tax=Halobacteriovorax sp. GB3 TaxID=2719615 RepID=UPI00235EF26D|nr:succinate dehydrogenase cytochrome b subunit [Halobacteriovorax sp. GB3]MDD0853297.1 succinate dehydrogenase cytochrome b subunit [Halobacteriovorax sp. GB3]
MASTLCTYLKTSVMKKQVMAVTGLLLCGFLVTHLIGNCLLYVGSDAFNAYAHALTSNKLIYVAEAILASIFLSHIGLAIRLTVENKKARPVGYYMSQMTGNGATFASRTMPYTGLMILIFLVLHLFNFKFGPVYMTTLDGVEVRDIYKTVVEYFQSPLNVLWYIVAMIALGIHLSHGFWSAFQSLGFSHPKYNCTLKLTSKLFAVVIAAGYIALPIYCYLMGGK